MRIEQLEAGRLHGNRAPELRAQDVELGPGLLGGHAGPEPAEHRALGLLRVVEGTKRLRRPVVTEGDGHRRQRQPEIDADASSHVRESPFRDADNSSHLIAHANRMADELGSPRSTRARIVR